MTNWLDGTSTPREAALFEHPLGERERARLAALGLLGQNFERQAAQATSGPSTGVIYSMMLGLAAGDVVTNIHLICTTLGSGWSGINMKVGIATKGNVKQAQSGDVSGLFGSTGGKTCPLSSPYTVPASDGYFFQVLAIASVTPILERARTAVPFVFGANPGAYGWQSGQTDLPNTPAPLFTNSNAIAFWVGWS